MASPVRHATASMHADHTVTFAALKPGLLFPPGSQLAGSVEVADIGLPCDDIHAHLVQQSDVHEWWQPREQDAHKWRSAVRVIAGSAGMTGAARSRRGRCTAHRCGDGAPLDPGRIAVRHAARVRRATARALELGHRRARLASTASSRSSSVPDSAATKPRCGRTRDVLRQAPVATVVDGDGLFALAWSNDGVGPILRDRRAPTVLTPHDGEFALDRRRQARRRSHRIDRAQLAQKLGVVVLLKGPASVVADPDGEVLVVTAGDERLATAGTGDVLSGIIGALIAHGLPPFEAAAAGSWIHGRAAAPRTAQRLHRQRPAAADPAGLGIARVRWAWAEVDLDAVSHNVGVLRSMAEPAQVWAVVKSDAYGHGAIPVAQAAIAGGATGLCVALAQEGVELRDAGIEVPILVLSQQPPDELASLVANRLIPTVHSVDGVEALSAVVARGRHRAVRRAPQGRHRHAPQRRAATRGCTRRHSDRRLGDTSIWPGCSRTSPVPTIPHLPSTRCSSSASPRC